MPIKITVTSNKYPTGKSTTTFGKGGVLINKGRLLRIQDTIKNPSSSINAKVVRAMEKAANIRIRETRQKATEHFQKTMAAITRLAQNSTVNAVGGGLSPHTVQRGEELQIVYLPTPYEERKSITAHISAPEVGVQTTKSWKTLNQWYFEEDPISKKFFTKRKGSIGRKKGGSSRLNMLRELKTFKSKASASSNVGLNPTKGTPASVSGKSSLTLKYSYTLSFPSLHKFDFIKMSYVHAAEREIDKLPTITTKSSEGFISREFNQKYGIIEAEKYRPFFRVIAAEAGKDLRKKLTKPP